MKIDEQAARRLANFYLLRTHQDCQVFVNLRHTRFTSVQRAAAPCNEGCVTLARIGEDAWAMGDSKQPDAQPLRFTTKGLDAAGIDPVRFDLNVWSSPPGWAKSPRPVGTS